jgi:adenine-specific DNA-methyltransferase
MGVGSSVVAALKNDRVGYGCDVVQEYVDIAWDRIADLRNGTLKMRPMNKPIYDPSLPGGGHK